MSESYPLYKKIGLVAGLVVFGALLFAPNPEGMTPEARKAGAVGALMAIWWITEALPIAATSLLPIALYPLLNVLSGPEVTKAYGDSNIFLFAGGFFIAMAMQKWNLHERIALGIIARTGTNPSRLVLGFMIGTGFVSMWMSNTATAVMMLPIAIAIVTQMEKRNYPGVANFATALLLSIAYAASIGGMGTPIGTPPNGILLTNYTGRYPGAPPVTFVQWMMVGVPIVFIMLPLTWLLLTRVLFNFKAVSFPAAREEIMARLVELGRMSRGERIVLTIWATTCFAWIFREDLVLGSFTIPGWTSLLLPDPKLVNDGTIAIVGALLLFLIPVDLKKGEFALDWEWARRIPWEVLLLFGGGLAMAEAFRSTHLVDWVGDQFVLLKDVPPLLIVLIVAALLAFSGEVTSNTATAAIMMPILAAMAPEIGIHPLLLMFPAGMAISCGFMLPAATPPNAIVFGAGRITVPQMARAGFLVDIMGVLLVTALMYLIGVHVFGIQSGVVPDWATAPPPAAP